MKALEKLNKQTILADEIFEEIFSQEDEIRKARMLLSLQDRAAELGIKGKFNQMVKAYRQVDRETKQKKKQEFSSVDNYTNFVVDGTSYENMYCGSWIATETGIYAQNMGTVEQIACYHPILPIERLKNLETGEEQIKLAFKRNGRWEEIIVPKVMITSASKIVALSGRGVAVTSENAKLLVRYLSDVENRNTGRIAVQYSSSKLGWIKNEFLPYDTKITFDGDSRFRQLFESIGEHGSRDKWYEYVKRLRRSGRMEIKLLLAASFASVLLHQVGALPFFVDLWGETEGGKTVTLMLAASVWANPAESAYIGDFKTTDVALEAKANMLNHLPMVLDDTSKKNRRIEENFEGVVYDLCSGKGKTRSNRDIGINMENHWNNCILTNGERPLISYVNQGGAINRILEIECGEKVYSDPQLTADTLKQNYGFAGKDFVEVIKVMGADAVREIQKNFQQQLFDDEKMQKQRISLSIILTADKIATETLFKDGQYISIDEAKKVLIDRNELSDNERCYQYILDKVAMNGTRFDADTACEKWGIIEHGYVFFYNQAFNELCKSGGFSRKSFLSWGVKKKIVETDRKGNPTKQKKIGGKNNRCVCLKLDDGIVVDSDGFASVDEVVQEEFPFQ
jgi:putative DNA primase/helicase